MCFKELEAASGVSKVEWGREPSPGRPHPTLLPTAPALEAPRDQGQLHGKVAQPDTNPSREEAGDSPVIQAGPPVYRKGTGNGTVTQSRRESCAGARQGRGCLTLLWATVQRCSRGHLPGAGRELASATGRVREDRPLQAPGPQLTPAEIERFFGHSFPGVPLVPIFSICIFSFSKSLHKKTFFNEVNLFSQEKSDQLRGS